MAGLAYPDYLHHNNSNYALVDESELRGSFRTITSKDDRNNIPSDKRALGAVVTWITDNIRYTKQYTGTDLTNINWQNDDNWSDFGGGSSGDITKYFYDIVNDKGRIDYSNIVNAPTISGSLGYNSVSIDSVVNDVFEKGTSNTVTITSNVIIDSGVTISNAVLNKTTNGVVTSESISLVSGVNILTTTLTDTTKLVISFTIIKDTLSTTITSNIYTVNFVYPYFYGVSDIIYTGSDVYNNLNKEVSIKNYAKKYSYTSNNQYFYFAYPIEYGSLLSILELSSNFNIKDDFTISTVTVNNSNWSHSYYLVRSSSLYTITAKSIKYILYESDINIVSTLQMFTPITNGDGTKYLSDDGSYKTVSGGGVTPTDNLLKWDSANNYYRLYTSSESPITDTNLRLVKDSSVNNANLDFNNYLRLNGCIFVGSLGTNLNGLTVHSGGGSAISARTASGVCSSFYSANNTALVAESATGRAAIFDADTASTIIEARSNHITKFSVSNTGIITTEASTSTPPSNQTTPLLWLIIISNNTQYKIPLYQ